VNDEAFEIHKKVECPLYLLGIIPPKHKIDAQRVQRHTMKQRDNQDAHVGKHESPKQIVGRLETTFTTQFIRPWSLGAFVPWWFKIDGASH